jgi:hypothetical protein
MFVIFVNSDAVRRPHDSKFRLLCIEGYFGNSSFLVHLRSFKTQINYFQDNSKRQTYREQMFHLIYVDGNWLAVGSSDSWISAMNEAVLTSCCSGYSMICATYVELLDRN